MKTISRTSKRSEMHLALVTLILILGLSFHTHAQFKLPYVNEKWTQPYEPFRMVGNLYYVGSYDLGMYLITTSQGHILINTGVAGSAEMLREHIEKMGFKLADIRVILTSQVHYDHVGALAEIKKLSGAKLMVHEKDAPVMADGGASDYQFGKYGPTFEPVKPDRVLHDGEVVSLGDMAITLLHHPGHTKGSSSFLFTVKEGAKSYKVLIANMPTVIVESSLDDVPNYKDIIRDYNYTFAALKQLKFDLWMAAHASQFMLHDKRTPGDAYNPAAFADRKGYDESLAELEKEYKEKVKGK